MKVDPRVLQLYAPRIRAEMDTTVEMRIRVFPYTPQAHFLVETLGEYHKHWNNRWASRDRYSLCREANGENPVAVLKGDELITNLKYLEFVRMFFGFHPSREVVTKLKELTIDDERTEQLLGGLRDLDKQFLYAYVGFTESKHRVLATKKRAKRFN